MALESADYKNLPLSGNHLESLRQMRSIKDGKRPRLDMEEDFLAKKSRCLAGTGQDLVNEDPMRLVSDLYSSVQAVDPPEDAEANPSKLPKLQNLRVQYSGKFTVSWIKLKLGFKSC